VQVADRRVPASPLGLFAMTAAFMLTVAHLPAFAVPSWSARSGALMLVVAVGLPVLVGMLRTPARPAAMAAMAFLAIAALSTVLSPQPALSLVGVYGWGTGLVFVGATISIWAVARATPPLDRRRLEIAFLAGVALNGLVAVLQTVADLGISELSLVGGRASALMGNPVHLGSLMAAAVAMAAWNVRRHLAWSAGVAAAAMALQLSGTRLALIVAALVALALAVPLRTRGIFVLVALVVGVLLGSALSELGGGVTGTERALVTVEGAAGQGVTARTETWWSARHALADRPILGAGPGRFRAATSPYRTLDLALAEAPDRLFADAHNLVVEYTVTTGLLGLLALVAWLVLASRGVSGPFLYAAGALLLMHLAQPQAVHVTPLAALCFGAAARPVQITARRIVAPGMLLAPAAVAAALALSWGAFWMDQGELDFDLNDARRADAVLGVWPQPAELRARILAFRSIDRREPSLLLESRDWYRRAANRDPTHPMLWNRLAQIEERLGHTGMAESHYLRALRLNPWSRIALQGLARVDRADDDMQRAEEWNARLRLLGGERPGTRRGGG